MISLITIIPNEKVSPKPPLRLCSSTRKKQPLLMKFVSVFLQDLRLIMNHFHGISFYRFNFLNLYVLISYLILQCNFEYYSLVLSRDSKHQYEDKTCNSKLFYLLNQTKNVLFSLQLHQKQFSKTNKWEQFIITVQRH